uniref:DUF2281 domain-containing protein n=1 Tax=Cyanothece sp. (strain PCC 7425 / ATCC 29141) TaxID=395961 RepID=B8HZG9_CYAP4
MSDNNVEVAVLKGLRELPPERQQEVLDFVDFLKSRTTSNRKSLKGILPDRDLSIEDFQEARRAIWAVEAVE